MSKKKISVQEQISDLENKWKRALADYANLEKRIDNEKQSFVKFSNKHLLEKLLPILDDLELCEKHLKDEGLTITLNKLKEILTNEGVKEIKAEGEEFNPHLMDATETTEGPKNKVVEVVRKGYLLDEKVLRVAKVKVGGQLKKGLEKELDKEKSRGDYM
jgi:molecular chaperone GrpE